MENLNAKFSRSSVSNEHHPCFFRIYLEEKNSITLRIPPPFTKNFNEGFPNNISLRNLSGTVWPAKLEFVDNKLHITGGWKRYVKDHSLTTGEFLVFRYLQNSTFLVVTYGFDGCIKQEPLPKPFAGISKGIFVASTAVGNLRYRRIFKTKFKSFVTVPKRVLKTYVVTLPREIMLLNEKGHGVRTKLHETQGKIIVGYTGVSEFWRINNVQMGNKLEFEFVRGNGNIIKEVVMRNLSQ